MARRNPRHPHKKHPGSRPGGPPGRADRRAGPGAASLGDPPARARAVGSPPDRPSRGPDQPAPGGGPDGLVWLYGLHAVRAALANPARRAHRLWLTREAARHWPTPGPGADGTPGPVPRIVERPELHRLLPTGAVHQGAALEAQPLAEPDLDDCLAHAGPHALFVVLDQATDPHNVGAILPSAASFWVASLLVPD